MATAIWLISCSIASNSEQGLHISAEDAYKIASYVGEFINASRDQGSRVSILIIKSTDGVAISNNPKIARPQRYRLQGFIRKLDEEKPSNVLTNNFMLHHDRKAAISRHGDLVGYHNGDHLVAHFSAICLAFGHHSEASKWQTSIGSGSVKSSLALSYSMLFDTVSDEDTISHEGAISYKDAIDWAEHGFGPAERERYLHVGTPAEIKRAPKSWLESWTTKK